MNILDNLVSLDVKLGQVKRQFIFLAQHAQLERVLQIVL
jgi:hypothetical protein